MKAGAERSGRLAAVLAAAGLDPHAVVTELLPGSGSGWRNEIHRVRGADVDAVLRVHPQDLAAGIMADPDPRSRTVVRTCPVAPFFRASSEAIDQVRRTLDLAVPEVLSEGRVERPDGTAVHFTLLSHLAGEPWPAATRRRGRVAADDVTTTLAAIARDLHGGSTVHDAALRARWLCDFIECLHFVADHAADGFAAAAERRRYHRRAMVAVAERLATGEIGPVVRVHGDLQAANLLRGADGRATALLDLELSCVAPAMLDFRWLSTLDERAFFAVYDVFQVELDRACWLGHCADLFWQGMAILALTRWRQRPASAAHRAEYLAQFDYLLALCLDDGLRQGAPSRREAQRRARRDDVRRAVRTTLPAVAPARPRQQTAIIVPAFRHLATTTAPCLDALRRFTDRPYRVICVDNDSADGTAEHLRRCAAGDPRIEHVALDHNAGWAGGSLAGLRRLRAADTHVLLLNSDTLVGPAWLSKLLAHLGRLPAPAFVVANERAGPDAATVRPAAPIEPGSLPPRPHGADLTTVVERTSAWELRARGRGRVAAPSGFCLLTTRAGLPLLRHYLTHFDAYHRRERDWQRWWAAAGARCEVVVDAYVAHARGGSGGYYAYEAGPT